MSIWRTRLLVLLTAVAMLLAVSGSAAMADDFDDCEFIGFDDGEALFLCEGDFDDDFDDDDFDVFFDDDFDDCLGAEIGDECFGIDTFDFDDDDFDHDFDDDDEIVFFS